MKYYYIHPSKPQYFFPKEFKKHKLFFTFFKPYSLFGEVSWFLFKNFGLYRRFFSKSNIEDFIPEQEIRELVGQDKVFAFNTGTIGPEQKITALGAYEDSNFFIKYAQTVNSINNVKNEHFILKQLSHLDFVPQVLDYFEDENQVLLKTNVLDGSRLGNTSLKQNILDCLLSLSNQDVYVEKRTASKLKTVFAHGDFCPWNMMLQNDKVLLFDWEMSGSYTLGYDLFTFIFQTAFLLEPKKPIEKMLAENNSAINTYFSCFNIFNWSNYLIAFAEEKMQLENNKGKKGMRSHYINLLNYVQKI